MNIITAIDETIKEHKISRSELANLTGLQRTYITRVLNARAQPTVDRVDLMINSLPPTAKVYFCWLLSQQEK